MPNPVISHTDAERNSSCQTPSHPFLSSSSELRQMNNTRQHHSSSGYLLTYKNLYLSGICQSIISQFVSKKHFSEMSEFHSVSMWFITQEDFVAHCCCQNFSFVAKNRDLPRNGNASYQVQDPYVKFIYKKENDKHIVQHYLIWVQENISILF